MGYWGVKSYENDDAGDDASTPGSSRFTAPGLRGADGRQQSASPWTGPEALADDQTLVGSVKALEEMVVATVDGSQAWDDKGRLALAGVVVRHAELGVAIPEALGLRAIDWLEGRGDGLGRGDKAAAPAREGNRDLAEGRPAAPGFRRDPLTAKAADRKTSWRDGVPWHLTA